MLWGTEDKQTADATPKLKVKTRATVADNRDPKTQRQGPNEHAIRSAEAPIAVNASSINLFASMFSSFGEAQGPTKWKALVATLTDAGLTAIHTGGSVVTFAHESTGAIAVREPHPDPEVSVIKLRWVGKRLRKWLAGMQTALFCVHDGVSIYVSLSKINDRDMVQFHLLRPNTIIDALHLCLMGRDFGSNLDGV